MLLLIVFAFIAGVVTVLSPCILPLLPIRQAKAAGSGFRLYCQLHFFYPIFIDNCASERHTC